MATIQKIHGCRFCLITEANVSQETFPLVNWISTLYVVCTV